MTNKQKEKIFNVPPMKYPKDGYEWIPNKKSKLVYFGHPEEEKDHPLYSIYEKTKNKMKIKQFVKSLTYSFIEKLNIF